MRLFFDDDTDGCLSYACDLRKALSENNHFRQDLACYAADSILYALGLQASVTEPAYHGFDPMEQGRSPGNGGAGAGAQQAVGAQAPGSAGQGSGAAHGGGAASAGNAGSNSSSKCMKLVIAASLIAGIAFGWLFSSLAHRQDSAEAHRDVSSTEVHGSSVVGLTKAAGADAGAMKSGANSEGSQAVNDEAAKKQKLEELEREQRELEKILTGDDPGP